MTGPVSPRTQRLQALQAVHERLQQGLEKFVDPKIVELFNVEEKSSVDKLVELVQLVQILESKTLSELNMETEKLNDEARKLLSESDVTKTEAAKLAEQIERLVHNDSK